MFASLLVSGPSWCIFILLQFNFLSSLFIIYVCVVWFGWFLFVAFISYSFISLAIEDPLVVWIWRVKLRRFYNQQTVCIFSVVWRCEDKFWYFLARWSATATVHSTVWIDSSAYRHRWNCWTSNKKNSVSLQCLFYFFLRFVICFGFCATADII